MMKKSKVEPRPRVLYKDPHIKSHAALLKLKRKLFGQRDLGLRPQWREWLTFRKWFLKEALKNGPLVCHYCGNGPLYKNQRVTPKSRLATLDHVKPRAEGGKEYDVNNLVVSCQSCNGRKGKMSYDEFLRIINRQNQRQGSQRG